MVLTRPFKSGNSQAIRMPAEMAYADTGVELQVTRLGDVITIVPVQHGLKAIVASLRAMPRPAEIEQYELTELPDRD